MISYHLAAGNSTNFGLSSSGKPPNPFQRLALIMVRLGLHCMRFGQAVGSRMMGALIQGMRVLLRMRGRYVHGRDACHRAHYAVLSQLLGLGEGGCQ